MGLIKVSYYLKYSSICILMIRWSSTEVKEMRQEPMNLHIDSPNQQSNGKKLI